MYDAHKLLNSFYNDHLRLGRPGRDKLAALRDVNLDRLREGLAELGPIRGATTAAFESAPDQGSYPMHTLNQHPDGDYDIDTAVIFAKSALPASALDARKRVVEALLLRANGFAKDPEARTNAVTVWYAEGHHVDLAVYRRTNSGALEHAGPEWSERDPAEITTWFLGKVKSASPSGFFDTVDASQLRRIVRFIKRYCGSRPSWSLPGGMITTTLVAEVYVPHGKRDDVSLRDTMTALRTRLLRDTSVANPVKSDVLLTAKERYAAQVRRLRDRLGETLSKLEILDDAACTKEQALKAWDAVFRHDFFGKAAKAASAAEKISVVVDVAQTEGGAIRMRYRFGVPLPKGVHVRFMLQRELTTGERVRWTVLNEGDEAQAANDLGHLKEGSDTVTWRHTAYRGEQRMRCEVLNGDRVLGTCERLVRIT